MICRSCGKEIADDTRFCPNCGQDQSLEAPLRSQVRPQVPPPARQGEKKGVEGLRWPAMVFGIFGGVATFIAGIFDLLSNPPAGAIALLASIVVFAVSAMTPSLPGWAALLFIILILLFAIVGASFSFAFAGPLLLIAAILAAIVAWIRRRQRKAATPIR
jgi:hypothetical protein